jgi:toxin-antitoxin system PIN domain toxin
MLLPDVNVWLALAFAAHVHHLAARKWFDGLTDEICYFCRLTQQGFLRLSTNASVFGKDALTLPEAWEKFDLMMSDARVSVVAEPADIEVPWRANTHHQSFSPHVWNDAYLAAFAELADLEIVTFDHGFKQYPAVKLVVLS